MANNNQNIVDDKEVVSTGKPLYGPFIAPKAKETSTATTSGQALRYQSALEKSNARYNQMIAEANLARETASGGVPSELTQTADMYAAGGTYGSGQRALVEENLKAGAAKEQAGLVSSGMSSGSMAAGVTGRYARNRATEFANIEDTRMDKLSTALSAVAAAKEARTGRMIGAYTTTAQLIQGFKEPTVGEFASAEELQAASDIAEKERLGMSLTSQEKITAMGITADMERQLLQITSAENLQAASDAAAKERLGMELTSEEQRAKDDIAAAANRLGLSLASAERQTKMQTGVQAQGNTLNYLSNKASLEAQKEISERRIASDEWATNRQIASNEWIASQGSQRYI